MTDFGNDICADSTADHWGSVEKDADGRVTEDAFVDYFSATSFGSAVPAASSGEYAAFLADTFTVAIRMMPLGDGHKGTIGGHCFKEVMDLPFAFYSEGNSGYCTIAPRAFAAVAGDECADAGLSHWDVVEKDADGRVKEEAFVDYFSATSFGSAVPAANSDAFAMYLKKAYKVAIDMMPLGDDHKGTIGGHCFKEVQFLPFAFYLNGNSG